MYTPRHQQSSAKKAVTLEGRTRLPQRVQVFSAYFSVVKVSSNFSQTQDLIVELGNAVASTQQAPGSAGFFRKLSSDLKCIV
jgi:hypothetical protein